MSDENESTSSTGTEGDGTLRGRAEAVASHPSFRGKTFQEVLEYACTHRGAYLPVELARRTVILPDGAMVAAVATVAEDGPVTLHVSCTRWPWWSEAAVGGENAGRIVTVPEDGHRSARTLVADRHPQVWARYEAGAIEFAVRRLASDTPDETWVDATACPSVLVLDPRDHIDGGFPR